MEHIVAYPALGLIWVVYWALRATGVIKSSGGSSSTDIRPGFWVFVLRLFAFGVAFAYAVEQGAWIKTIILGTVALACWPTLLIEAIAVPLGLPRLAFWVTVSLRPLYVVSGVKSIAVGHAARALLGEREPSLHRIAWLQDELSRSAKGRGATLVAEGLLAVLRRDLRAARALLRTADTLHPSQTPRPLRRAARDWLVADAAAAGNWDEVVTRGVRAHKKMRWSYAVGRMAQRLTGRAGAPWRATMIALWILAPHRLTTFSLLRRALGPSASKPAPKADQDPNLAYALGRLASLHENPATASNGRLLETVRALEEALEAPQTRALVQRRALALGATRSPEDLLGQFREQIETALGTLLDEGAATQLPEDPPALLGGAVRRARQRLLRELESYCADYKQRAKAMIPLSELDEWRAWAHVRDSGERLLAIDPGSEAAMYQVVYFAVCNFAVFQHNDMKRRGMAHQMFDWLHDRAMNVGSVSESALTAENMKASLS
jgi:hypothetical protein